MDGKGKQPRQIWDASWWENASRQETPKNLSTIVHTGADNALGQKGMPYG